MYIWEKYRTFEITSGIILKMNLPLYKGFTLEITNKWWPLTTLSRWPLYRIKLYSKMHRESTKVTVMKRWPLYKGDRYDRFDCMYNVTSILVWHLDWYTYILWNLNIDQTKCHLYFMTWSVSCGRSLYSSVSSNNLTDHNITDVKHQFNLIF